MPRELINPETVHPALGYSHIAVGEGTRIVSFAGQVALDDDLKIVGEGDLREQVLASMRNLRLVMDHVGATWDDIVRRTVYTTQPHELDTLSGAISEATDGAGDPPQTIVGVTGLALPGLMVEIECTAVLAN